MAILFKDNGGDLLTDIDLVNPYTNAIKNADNVVGMVDKMQGMFALQTEKNRLMEKEAVTGAAMADIMAGREPNLEGIDPTTVDFNTLMNFAQKKSIDDATATHQSVMQIEAARAAKASEGSRDIAEENRQLVRLEVTANKKEKLKIAKATQALKDKQFDKDLLSTQAKGIVEKTVTGLIGKDEQAIKKKISTMSKSKNLAEVAASKNIMTRVNAQRKDAVTAQAEEFNKILIASQDPLSKVEDNIAAFEATGLKQRAPLPLDTIDSPNAKATLLTKFEKVKELYPPKFFSGETIKAEPTDLIAQTTTFGGATRADVTENLITRIEAMYENAIAEKTGRAKQKVEDELTAFRKSVVPGTREEALRKKIRDVNLSFKKYTR